MSVTMLHKINTSTIYISVHITRPRIVFKKLAHAVLPAEWQINVIYQSSFFVSIKFFPSAVKFRKRSNGAVLPLK